MILKNFYQSDQILASLRIDSPKSLHAIRNQNRNRIRITKDTNKKFQETFIVVVVVVVEKKGKLKNLLKAPLVRAKFNSKIITKSVSI